MIIKWRQRGGGRSQAHIILFIYLLFVHCIYTDAVISQDFIDDKFVAFVFVRLRWINGVIGG